MILVSSDWEEIIKLADRALVMRDGEIVGELTGRDINESTMLHLCTERRQRRVEKTQAESGVRKLARSLFSSGNRIAVLSIMLADGVPDRIPGLAVLPQRRSTSATWPGSPSCTCS